jgi:ABC-type branched-subunit amino acid transport system ATPase component
MSAGPKQGLVVEDLSVRYGGHLAVSDLTLEAPAGEVTGLIGPNGAGKTTTFNACSGLVRPADGRVLLYGRNVTHTSSQHRARLGMGRTFQRIELWDSLSVAENVALGREAAMAGSNPWRHLSSSRSDAATVRAAVDDALSMCAVNDLSAQRPADLATGQRRLVELARCIAGRFSLMLLDEPSSGLDKAETARFGAILRDLVETRDIGILLVEHDMGLVMNVCDYIYVLDFGQPIFQGTPHEVSSSEVVRSAYLGSGAVETAIQAEDEAFGKVGV